MIDCQKILKTTERIVLTVAGLAALFPLWQFWDEREDRRLERSATFIIAYTSCEGVRNELAGIGVAQATVAEEVANLVRSMAQSDPSEAEQSGSALVTSEALEAAMTTYQQRLSLLDQGIGQHCEFIATINDPPE